MLIPRKEKAYTVHATYLYNATDKETCFRAAGLWFAPDPEEDENDTDFITRTNITGVASSDQKHVETEDIDDEYDELDTNIYLDSNVSTPYDQKTYEFNDPVPDRGRDFLYPRQDYFDEEEVKQHMGNAYGLLGVFKQGSRHLKVHSAVPVHAQGTMSVKKVGLVVESDSSLEGENKYVDVFLTFPGHSTQYHDSKYFPEMNYGNKVWYADMPKSVWDAWTDRSKDWTCLKFVVGTPDNSTASDVLESCHNPSAIPQEGSMGFVMCHPDPPKVIPVKVRNGYINAGYDRKFTIENSGVRNMVQNLIWYDINFTYTRQLNNLIYFCHDDSHFAFSISQRYEMHGIKSVIYVSNSPEKEFILDLLKPWIRICNFNKIILQNNFELFQ